jgi:uncharacterized protein YndB with AHSA1/START domain
MENKKINVVTNFDEKSILVSKEFNAPTEFVWQAFTNHMVLDQWWGPDPWHAVTKSMDFKEGGSWLYAMVGPAGEKHWSRMEYIKIIPLQSYELIDGFCDEHGKWNEEMPVSKGQNVFTGTPEGTRVDFKMFFPTVDGLQKTVEMGFEQGITICMDQLDKLIEQKRIPGL